MKSRLSLFRERSTKRPSCSVLFMRDGRGSRERTRIMGVMHVTRRVCSLSFSQATRALLRLLKWKIMVGTI
jgi:hypothetical protein